MWNRILKPLRGGQEGLDLPEASGRRCRRNFLTSRPRVGIHLMKRCHFKDSIDGSHKLYYGMRVPGGWHRRTMDPTSASFAWIARHEAEHFENTASHCFSCKSFL